MTWPSAEESRWPLWGGAPPPSAGGPAIAVCAVWRPRSAAPRIVAKQAAEVNASLQAPLRHFSFASAGEARLDFACPQGPALERQASRAGGKAWPKRAPAKSVKCNFPGLPVFKTFRGSFGAAAVVARSRRAYFHKLQQRQGGAQRGAFAAMGKAMGKWQRIKAVHSQAFKSCAQGEKRRQQGCASGGAAVCKPSAPPAPLRGVSTAARGFTQKISLESKGRS